MPVDFADLTELSRLRTTENSEGLRQGFTDTGKGKDMIKDLIKH